LSERTTLWLGDLISMAVLPLGARVCDRLCFRSGGPFDYAAPKQRRRASLPSLASRPTTRQDKAQPPREEASWMLLASTAVGATTAGMGGFVFAYTSPVLANDCSAATGCPRCLNCELEMSEADKALTASLAMFGGLLGSLAAGPVVDRIGRRAGLVLGAGLGVAGLDEDRAALLPLPAAMCGHSS
jgi:hypothetical protein